LAGWHTCAQAPPFGKPNLGMALREPSANSGGSTGRGGWLGSRFSLALNCRLRPQYGATVVAAHAEEHMLMVHTLLGRMQGGRAHAGRAITHGPCQAPFPTTCAHNTPCSHARAPPQGQRERPLHTLRTFLSGLGRSKVEVVRAYVLPPSLANGL